MDDKEKHYSFLGLDIGRIGWWGSLIAFFSIPLLSLFYFLWFVVGNELSLSKNPEDWAQFGDYLAGTAGPIIGFASVILLVATLYHQRLELKEQREGLAQSIKETAEQNRILALQSFEQSFFAWLKDYKEQVDDIQVVVDPDHLYHQPSEPLSSRQALEWLMRWCFQPHQIEERLYNSSYKRLQARSLEISSSDLDYALKHVLKTWGSHMVRYADSLGSLLRTLYGLIRWIDRHKQLTSEEKYHYISIIRARLSNAELRMLFINGMSEDGKNFVDFINKYSLFDNLPKADLPFLDALKEHQLCPYQKIAYQTPKSSDEP